MLPELLPSHEMRQPRWGDGHLFARPSHGEVWTSGWNAACCPGNMNAIIRTACDEGVIRGSAREAPGYTTGAKRWVLAATILGSGMAFIDGSVVSVALPAIQRDMGASLRAAQWIVNAYMLTLAALMLAGGAAGDRYGRRRVFSIGVVVFTLASLACGFAPNTSVLVIARAVQGIGGALMVPESLAMISAAFPEAERGRAIGTWAGFSALTTALGPVLGGWLVDAASWRAIFFVNAPLGLLALAIALWRVPESRDESARGQIDWRGAVLATLSLGAIAYGLTIESELGWRHPLVLGSLIASLLLAAAFLRWEARAPSPMMPLALFRSRAFSGANALTLLLYFAISAALFFLPFNLIGVEGYSAMAAGAAFLPFTLIMGGLSRWSGALIERYGARTPLIVGPLIVAVGLAMCALPAVGQSYWTGFFPAMAVLGFGTAVSVAPLTTVVMDSAGDKHSGVASGVNNAVSRVAGLLAVALLGAIAIGQFRSALESRLSAAHVSTELRAAMQAQASKLGEAQVPGGLPEADHDRLTRLMHKAFLDSFRVVMLTSAVMAMLSAMCAWVAIPRNIRRADRPGRGRNKPTVC
jgi:EmrB/QacA subfamily drug resistance transporter